jgi:hypothetical protein
MSRQPFRSRLVVVLCWLLPLILAPFKFAGVLNSHYFEIVLVLWFVGNIFLSGFLARLYRRSAQEVLTANPSALVVYLRSFDHEEIMSPANIFLDRSHKRPVLFCLSILLVATPHVVTLALAWPCFANHGDAWALVMSFLSVLSAIAFVLLVCFRILYGQLSLTLEAELSRVFECVGPMVAIGRPGDWFAPRGAARMYLSDETWKEEVMKLIKRASIVVVQPAVSEGTWWELRNVLRLRDPHSVLFCFPHNFESAKFAGEDRELFSRVASTQSDLVCLKLESEFNIKIDDIKKKAPFLGFGDDWEPHEYPIVLRHWMVWPFAASRLSRKTFGPLIAYAKKRSNNGDAIEPR